MKKIMTMLIVGILVLIGLEAVAVSYPKNSSKFVDELDQSMTSFEGVLPVGNTNIFGYYTNLSAGQSFTPEKEILTRAQFLMARNSTSLYPCYLAVRDNLTQENLAIIAIEPENFPEVNGTPTEEQLAWVEFNFNDLKITPGTTYYFAIYTENITENYYWVSGNGTNVYLNGTVYLSVDEGATWSELVDSDACFKTYGRSNQAPSIPSIDGQTKGKVGTSYTYTLVTTDPDGDDVYYIVSWGCCQNETHTYGPYASGVEVNVNHTWSEKGTFTIKVKAKDIFDSESDWATLEVRMPRGFSFQSLFMKFLKRLTDVFPILKNLLGL